MKIPEPEVKPGAPDWVVTFGDMMSLLMVFFVLLLSFSTMEIEKFKTVAGMMREAFGVQAERSFADIPSGQTVMDPNQDQEKSDDSFILLESVKDWVIQEELQDLIKISLEERGVILRASGQALFDPGQVKVREDAHELLDQIARFVLSSDAILEVQGHTDPSPTSAGSPFPSNWELSSARAGAVVRYLVGVGLRPGRLRAVGLADTVPVVENSTAAGRAQNRRVEFVFIRE